MNLLDDCTASATLSPCGTYRYMLERHWTNIREHGQTVVWVMLNPSTADAETDDRTIRKCIEFSKRWGYSALTVVNLFALRSSTPKALYKHPDPIGEVNDTIIEIAATSAYTGVVVAAWGQHGAHQNRGLIVSARLRELESTPMRIGPPTKGGHPWHPLYRPYEMPLEVHA